ncbi:hypothetical protein [Rhodalgimonas zhirmunskyi]|uniref:NnrT protein n=1 Tax=Rhodalgimonas zhirmunskyi TaxID=2964767 RepID=A0AAJ1U7Q6_9RHOB|nr:hypothetical protein [Rhodoalgimonas zhirmunskyi]MDQ2095140.1 hypothetical protein [Rhodoalgimonas zhirmunskyi]
MTHKQKPRLPRPSWKLLLGLYPFMAAAVAINLFLMFLMLQALGVDALAPVHAVLASIPLGVPATWAAARWVQHLIAEAERTPR